MSPDIDHYKFAGEDDSLRKEQRRLAVDTPMSLLSSSPCSLCIPLICAI